MLVHIAADDQHVFDLGIEAAYQAEPVLRSAVGLRLVVCLLVNFMLELGRNPGALQHAVLAPSEVGFQPVLAESEGEDERFPWDGRAVEEGRAGVDEAVEEFHALLPGWACACA